MSGSQLTTYPISFGLFLKEDIKRIWNDFLDHQLNIQTPSTKSIDQIKLDGLICNAGALLDEKKLTYRFRQLQPNKKYSYRTIPLTIGLKAVIIINKRNHFFK